MALVKTVEMRVLADAGDAQARLDELDGKAKELGAEDIKMRFRVDSGDAKTQFDDLKARADELGLKDVTIKVKVDGKGRAIADLQAIRAEADKATGGTRLDKIGDLTGKIGGALSGGGSSIFGAIPGIGGALGPLAGAGPLGLAAAAAAVAASVGAVLTELTGLVSGFAAAGAGAGAFAALALPAVKSVETAYSGLSKAQTAFHTAQAKEAADPTKTNQTALASAALNLKLAQEAIHKLPADEQSAISGIRNIAAEFGQMSKAFQPQVFKVFADGLGIIKNLLPAIVPFASTFATSLDKLLQQAGKFTQSTGFKDWLKQFQSLEGPALGAIGAGIGQVANAFGKLLTTMSGKDVAHAINIAFDGVSGTISAVAATVKYFMNLWDGAGIAIATGAHAIASGFDSIRHGFAGIGHDIAAEFDTARGAIAGEAAAIVGFFTGLPGKIKGIFAGAGGWLTSAGTNIMRGLESGAKAAWSAVSGWLSGLGGTIRGYFAGAGGWLISTGANIVQGLIGGMESKLGGLQGIVTKIEGIVKSIAGDLGIHSPSTVFYGYGQSIAQGLQLGMISGGPQVTAASRMLTMAAASGYTSAAGINHARAVAAGGQVVNNFHFHGVIDKQGAAREIHQVMAEYKRNGGGRALGLA